MSGSRLETFKLTVLFPLLKLNVFFNHTQLVNNFNLCNLFECYLLQILLLCFGVGGGYFDRLSTPTTACCFEQLPRRNLRLVVTYLFNSLLRNTPLLFVLASPGLVYYTIYHSLPTLQSFLYWIYSLMDFQIIIKYQHTYLLK